MAAVVSLSQLSDAVEFVSASAAAYSEGAAYVHLPTGTIHIVPVEDLGFEEEEMPPGDVKDPALFLAIPSWGDFDLGRPLVMRFVREHMPHDEEEVRGYFARKGGYGRYSSLLARRGLRAAWHTFRDRAQEEALTDWADENGLQLGP